jgi:hypothetical protein
MWFCVSTLSVSEHPDGSVPAPERLWEEHFFLVMADDAAQARAKGEKLARNQECSYTAANGSGVSWKFKTISKVCELDSTPADGAEVFSRFLKESEVESIMAPLP